MPGPAYSRSLSLPMFLPTFVSCTLSIAATFILLGVVSGQTLRNVTLDDLDPAIRYVGTWHVDINQPAFFGNGHSWSDQVNSYAVFTFTGVAVYYLAPLYRDYVGGVSTLLALDNGPAQLVNLTRVGTENYMAAVRWSATGLANGRHTVTNSLGLSADGRLAAWGVVDGFIYTAEESPTTSSSVSPTTSSSASPSLTSTLGSTEPQLPSSSLAVGGIVGGVLGGLSFLGFLLFLCFRKRSGTEDRENLSHQRSLATTDGQSSPSEDTYLRRDRMGNLENPQMQEYRDPYRSPDGHRDGMGTTAVAGTGENQISVVSSLDGAVQGNHYPHPLTGLYLGHPEVQDGR